MKKLILSFLLAAISLAACKKYHVSSQSAGGPFVGDWSVVAITTYDYDAAGLRDSNAYTYSGTPNIDHYSFRFNVDQTWVESFSASLADPLNIAANGTYTITSDSSFTLTYPNATANTMNEPCKILSLTDHLFIFSKQLATVFNGTDPGYIKYVFRLTR